MSQQNQIKYIPLKNKSSYSLLESNLSISQLIAIANNLDFPAIGLTDTQNMFGALDFALEAVKKGLQPIIGCTIVLSNISQDHTITLFAKNANGYKNLIHLTSLSYQNSDDLYQKISFEQLEHYSNNIICTYDYNNNHLQNKESIIKIKNMFNKEESLEYNFFCEISRSRRNPNKEKNLIDFCNSNCIPLVATNTAYFDKPENFLCHKVLRCIDLGEYISNYTESQVSEENYLKSQKEMLQLFSDIPDAIANTLYIAKKCLYFPKKQPVIFPKFKCKISEKDDLTISAIKGLIDKFNYEKNNQKQCKTTKNTIETTDNVEQLKTLLYQNVPKEYADQLFYELDVINGVNFPGYFLIVADFIQWAKNNNIAVGPGRGSGAGSVVAWSIGITEIDPIRFGLVFERFLNPDRISLPDFDIDFCQERRSEVINYVKSLYGYDHVAHIITFGKLQAKAVLKDVGRVLQMPYSQVDKIASLIPFSAVQAVTLGEAIQKEKKLQEMAENDGQIKQLFDIALQLEGSFRHVSMHAAGIVISNDKLMNVLPLYREPDSTDLITQFHMYGVEAAGLIKFDFLGLKTLSVIQKTLEMVRELHKTDISINHIPLDDQKTFEMLRKKLTLGVFQLEGGGMTDVLEQLNIDSFEQIIALISLYRPGPMENIPHYMDCKNGKAEVVYAYDCLEPILKETYGIPVYQEQVMQIARILGGYTLAQADLLRRAMGKKLPEEMKKHEETFVESTYKNQGGSKEKALKLFNQIAKFSGYAFNKAHATSYAMISYQTAYLKANYPIEFITALMIFDIHNTDKLVLIVQEARKLGIEILKPDINKSHIKFTVEDGCIRYGLGAIKGLGEGALQVVIDERNKNGKFSSIYDMMERIPQNTFNKRQIEHLIASGSFDDLHKNRKELYENAKNINAEKSTNELSLFDEPIINVVNEDWTSQERIEKEFEVFGFYIDEHPIEAYSDFIGKISATNVSTIYEDLKTKKSVIIAATINKITKKMNKNREKYAFVKISDNYGICEITIFPKELEKYENILFEGANYLFYISGKEQNETIRLTCDSLSDLSESFIQSIENITFFVKTKEQLQNIKHILDSMEKQRNNHKIRINLSINTNNCTIKILMKKHYTLSKNTYDLVKKCTHTINT